MAIISNIAYLLVFLFICVAMGVVSNAIMLVNGIFFVVYYMNMWLTGMDTFDFYDRRYFVVDMLSIAIYINIAILYFKKLTAVNFVKYFLVLLALNELMCLLWDVFCFFVSKKKEALRFHFIWALLTAIGIFVMIISVILLQTLEELKIGNGYLILDVVCIIYETILLICWWYSAYKIKKH